MNDFPPEYAKPMRPITGVLWLWIIVFAVCGGLLFFPFGYRQDYSGNYSNSCLSNLKQISLASLMYASDNDESLPPFFTFEGRSAANSFMSATRPYLKNDGMYLCVLEQVNLAENRPLRPHEGIPGKMDVVHCQSLKGVISDYSKGNRCLNLNEVQNEQTTPYIREPICGSKDGLLTSLHGKGFRIGYLDMHVKKIGNLDINKDL